MMFKLLLLAVCCAVAVYAADENYAVPQGFQDVWYGDKHDHTECTSKSVPSWIDGLFMCQSSASYGDQRNPDGSKLIHMFDAISAVAMFDVNPAMSTFTAAYYPTQPEKIWSMYDRDLNLSTVAWITSFSPYDYPSQVKFTALLENTPYYAGTPNVDFWKIGNKVVAGTEEYNLGVTYNVTTLKDFVTYQFIENNTYFNKANKDKNIQYVPLHMPIHERSDSTGLLWDSISTLKIAMGIQDMHELVFTADSDGVRNIVADYNGYNIDLTKCDQTTGKYSGDPSMLPGYMHSTTSTENYFIMPLSSHVLNPCFLTGKKPKPNGSTNIWDPNKDTWPYYYYSDAPLRFLLYNKMTQEFTMVKHTVPHFVTHQFNAYEVDNDTIIVDMIVYDYNAYDQLFLNVLENPTSFNNFDSHIYRFTLFLANGTSKNESLLPELSTAMEFSQFNHKYEGKYYKYGYILNGAYVSNSSIVKIDMDDHSGANNKVFYPGRSISLSEPVFIPSEGAKDEDDGVVMVRGIDMSSNKTIVYIVDAKTMTELGDLEGPDVVPFGFHNRFFSRASLNLPPTPSSALRLSQSIFVSLLLAVFAKILI